MGRSGKPRAIEVCEMQEQQRVEVAAAIGVQARDLTVEDSRPCGDTAGDFGSENFPLGELVVVAAHQATVPFST